MRGTVACLSHRGARRRSAQDRRGPGSCRAPRQRPRSASGSSLPAMVVDNCVIRHQLRSRPRLGDAAGQGVDRFDQQAPREACACRRGSSHLDCGSGRWLQNVRTRCSIGTRPQASDDAPVPLVARTSLPRHLAPLARRVGQTGEPTLVARIALPADPEVSSRQGARPWDKRGCALMESPIANWGEARISRHAALRVQCALHRSPGRRRSFHDCIDPDVRKQGRRLAGPAVLPPADRRAPRQDGPARRRSPNVAPCDRTNSSWPQPLKPAD